MFAVAWALVCVTVWQLSRSLRRLRAVVEPAAARTAELGLYEVAFLAGQEERVVETAIAGMHENGRLVVSRTLVQTTITDPKPRDEVEAAVIDAVGTSRSAKSGVLLQVAKKDERVRRIGARLRALGMYVDPDRRTAVLRARGRLVNALIAVFFLGWVAIGWEVVVRSEVLGPVVAFPVLLIAGCVAWSRLRPDTEGATEAGRDYLRQLGKRNDWRPRNNAGLDGTDAALLGSVALQGYHGLPVGHALGPPVMTGPSLTSGSGSSGSSGDNGGGGCGSGSGDHSCGGGHSCGGCGGGCGGCGGCGG
ncbi:TIGR04222 domain-containing membrane protein [Streptomyces sp. NRRL WC-3742]|uniref:TIGR04222 domain-containing membrane protein n=1 Tax=Streptomyces sp. NRRL WC-3742 TaxID=1463934 RepID=UPI00131D8C50|nr:TIGR04222 domain-containing membrane protein [Streptomyces sp. NRRL WC-3742]